MTALNGRISLLIIRNRNQRVWKKKVYVEFELTRFRCLKLWQKLSGLETLILYLLIPEARGAL